MKKKIRKVLTPFFCLLLLAAMFVPAFAESYKTFDFYWDGDTSGLITAEFDYDGPYAIGDMYLVSSAAPVPFGDVSTAVVTTLDPTLSEDDMENSWELSADRDYMYMLADNGGYVDMVIAVYKLSGANTGLYLPYSQSGADSCWTSRITYDYISSSVIDEDNLLSVFGGVLTWLVSFVPMISAMFFVNGSLSFLGYLAVAGLAVGVMLLIFYLISRFTRFGG